MVKRNQAPNTEPKCKAETKTKKAARPLTAAQLRKVERFKKRIADDEQKRGRAGFLPRNVETRC